MDGINLNLMKAIRIEEYKVHSKLSIVKISYKPSSNSPRWGIAE